MRLHALLRKGMPGTIPGKFEAKKTADYRPPFLVKHFTECKKNGGLSSAVSLYLDLLND